MFHRGDEKARRLQLVVLTCFALLLVNAARMQIFEGPRYKTLSEKNRIRVIYLEGPRGKIVDRNGLTLVTNRLSFNCSVVPREAASKLHKSCRIVAPILGVEPEELEKRFEKRRAGSSFNSVVLAEDIPQEAAIAIEERLDRLPGFVIETRPQRQYPLAEAAAHVTGYIGSQTREEAEDRDLYEYAASDWVGRDGIEKGYEAFLRGRSGGLQIEINSRGRIVKPLGVKEPKDGKNIQLTVDARLQSLVHTKLGGAKGAVVVMDLAEGGILSLNSSPSFDPNLFATSQGRRRVGRYLTDPRAPMLNRAIRGAYPPGSIYKIVTSMASLKRRKMSPSTRVNCPGWLLVGGRRFPCWKKEGHGSQDLEEAFAHSCNAYFYSAGLSAGLDAILERNAAFGFGELSGIDLPGERRGFIPTREWKKKTTGQGWYDGETANLSIGQGYLQVTPIQAMAMTAAVATGGEKLQPHVIEKINGVKVSERYTKPLDADPADLAAVKRGLEAVVHSDTGTGRLARLDGVRVAGKSGTAQSGQRETHAWFVAYAPAEKPKVAVAVFLEGGGRGGVAAAPIVQDVLEWLKGAGYL